MTLPRFLANPVRVGASPEIVTTRNFDDLGSVLENYAQTIEGLDALLAKIQKKRYITGSGTPAYLPIWLTPTTQGNSPISYNSGTNMLTASANLTVTGTALVTGAATFAVAPTISTFTLGSVPYASTAGLLAQNNSQFFWDATNKSMVVGDNANTGLLLVSTGDFMARGTAAAGNIPKYRAQAAGVQGYFVGDRVNGSLASPTALAADDFIVSFLALGYHGTGTAGTHCSEMRYYANQNWTATARGSRIEWYTIQNGNSTQDISMSLGADGLRGLVVYGPITTTQPVTGGVAKVSTWPFNSSFAMFSHSALDNTVATNYALLQQNDGTTYLNASSGKSINVNINNSAALTITATSSTFTTNVKLGTVGNGIYIKEGTNATLGNGTLVGGTLVVNNTKVTANSEIFIGDKGGGVLANAGALYEDSAVRVAGTSFTVKSLNILDTSKFCYLIVEPA